MFLVEFDPESQWLAVAATIAAGYLRAGGRVVYAAELRSPETVRENLLALGVDLSAAISEGRVTVDDWYSATLTGGKLEEGGPSIFEPIEGGHRVRSLKVADISVQLLKDLKQGPELGVIVENWPPGALTYRSAYRKSFDSMKRSLTWNLRSAEASQTSGEPKG